MKRLRFLHTPVSGELRREFDGELIRRNYWMVPTLLPIILIFQAYNMVNVVFLHKGLSTPSNRAYFFLYLFLFLITAGTIVLGICMRSRAGEYGGFLLGASFAYALLLSLFGVGITVLDARLGFNINVYSVIIISLAIFIYMRPWQSVAVFLGSFTILCLFMVTRQDWNYNAGQFINLTALCVISLCMSLSRYHNKAADFLSQHVITKQNQQIRQMNEELRRMAVTDVLTGLYNRRYLEEELFKAWQESRPRGVGVLMLDIDNFKQYNDRYGHQAGDACIQAIARTMEQCTCPGRDYLVRYGGEEFTAILFDTDSDKAWGVAQAIQSNVEQMVLSGNTHVTVSEGLYLCDGDEDCTLQTCLSRADKALYQAKRDGKNRVALYQ